MFSAEEVYQTIMIDSFLEAQHRMFRCPLMYYGTGALDRVATLGGKKALVVTDKNINRIGLVSEIEKRLQDSGTEVRVFDEVEPDPKDKTVARCTEMAVEFNPDLIIGFGGGSSLDVAKAAFFKYERPEINLCDMSALENYGLRQKARLVAIPTTSGTGSEASLGCVITDSETGRKLSLACYELVPDVAIMDPVLAFKMPSKLRASTGIDVLVHAMEAYVAKVHNEFADAVAIKAILTVFDSLEKSFRTGNEPSMEKMHYAATFAGVAMSNSGLGIAHAVGHSIGALFHVPHGLAVGFALPYAIEYSAETSKDRFLEVCKLIGVRASRSNSAQKLSRRAKELMTNIQVATTIKELGIDETEFKQAIPKLTEFSENDVTALTAPRSPSTEELTKILEYMLKNKAVDF